MKWQNYLTIIGKQKVTKQIIVKPTHVVQRQSSDILAVNDNDVVSAVLLIKQNAKNKIRVDDVLKAT